jgi:hypothetical protein
VAKYIANLSIYAGRHYQPGDELPVEVGKRLEGQTARDGLKKIPIVKKVAEPNPKPEEENPKRRGRRKKGGDD